MSFVIIEYKTTILSGGMGDRIVGLVSAILLSKALRRKLLIKWDRPNIRPMINLGIYDFYSVRPSITSAMIMDIIDKRAQFKHMFTHDNLIDAWKGRNVVLQCNQELGSFLFQNPYLTAANTALYQCNYVDEMMKAYRAVFSQYLRLINPQPAEALRRILHPSIQPSLQPSIPPSTSQSPQSPQPYTDLSLKSPIDTELDSKPKLLDVQCPPYIAVQLRTGDAYMNVGPYKPVQNINEVVQQIASYITVNFTTVNVVYITTDHPNVGQMFRSLLPTHTVIDTPSSRVHLDRHSLSSTQLQSLITDITTLIQADHLIISTYSNYGRICALMNTKCKTILGIEKSDFKVHPVILTNLFTNDTPIPLNVIKPMDQKYRLVPTGKLPKSLSSLPLSPPLPVLSLPVIDNGGPESKVETEPKIGTESNCGTELKVETESKNLISNHVTDSSTTQSQQQPQPRVSMSIPPRVSSISNRHIPPQPSLTRYQYFQNAFQLLKKSKKIFRQ